MVKNTKGGKNHKKYGRKFSQIAGKQSLREAKDEGEMYGCVSKVLGNNMCHVLTQKNITMLLHIRNKFRGRGKRDNAITNGTFVLIGERSFESRIEGKMPNCDLLEVYNVSEIETLQKNVNDIEWSIFKVITDTLRKENEDNDTLGFEFSSKNNDDTLDEDIIKQLENDKNSESVIGFEDEIDIDDI